AAPAPMPMGLAGGRGGGYLPAYPPDSESYAAIDENTYRHPRDQPLSTFSIDVDTASYANVRRFLNEGQLPPADAVRIEELINYFRYQQPEPEGEAPVGVQSEVSACPWQPAHRLVRIGLRARSPAHEQLPP